MWPTETIRLVAKMQQGGIFLALPHDDVLLDQLDRLGELRLDWLELHVPFGDGTVPKPSRYLKEVIEKCQDYGIMLIATIDTPPAINAKYPVAFARFCKEFAERYPEIEAFSCIELPYSTAISLSDTDDGFVDSIALLAKASILARRAIKQVWIQDERSGNPLFLQTENLIRVTPLPGSNQEGRARTENQRRFMALDLMLGYDDKVTKRYVTAHGLTVAEYEWFMEHGSMQEVIGQFRHTSNTLQKLDTNKVKPISIDPISLTDLIKEYWKRYPLPFIVVDKISESESVNDRQVDNSLKTVGRLRGEGYPALGIGIVDATTDSDLIIDSLTELRNDGLPVFDHREIRYRMEYRKDDGKKQGKIDINK